MNKYDLKRKLKSEYDEYINTNRLTKLANPKGVQAFEYINGVRTAIVVPVPDALSFDEWVTDKVVSYVELLLQSVAQEQLKQSNDPVEKVIREEVISFYLSLIEDVQE